MPFGVGVDAPEGVSDSAVQLFRYGRGGLSRAWLCMRLADSTVRSTPGGPRYSGGSGAFASRDRKSLIGHARIGSGRNQRFAHLPFQTDTVLQQVRRPQVCGEDSSGDGICRQWTGTSGSG